MTFLFLIEKKLQSHSVKLGYYWGHYIYSGIVQYLRRRAKRFHVNVSGQEHIAALAGQCYVLVSNHNVPKNYPFDPLTSSGFLRQFRYPIDSFIFYQFLDTYAGARLNTVTYAWHGGYSPILWKRWIQRHLWQPFIRGQFDALSDFLGVETQTGLYQRHFVRNVAQAVKAGKPVLIFPGDIFLDGDQTQPSELRAGASYIAQKFNLPILPACIVGGASWNSSQIVTIAFGEPFMTAQMRREEINEEIVRRVRNLLASLSA